ncbi:MAG: hypothetical protein P8Y48_03030 [Novosphingobium sp.]
MQRTHDSLALKLALAQVETQMRALALCHVKPAAHIDRDKRIFDNLRCTGHFHVVHTPQSRLRAHYAHAEKGVQ